MFTERQPARIKTIAKVLIKYQHHLIQHQQPSDTHTHKNNNTDCALKEREKTFGPVKDELVMHWQISIDTICRGLFGEGGGENRY